MNWRDLTDAEREALPLGSEGWRYPRGATLPKGRYLEELREPKRFASGGVGTKVRWVSNGVGRPSMHVIGTTKDYEPPDHQPGYYLLPKGGYKPATFGAKSKGTKLEAGEMAFGNIKVARQKKSDASPGGVE